MDPKGIYVTAVGPMIYPGSSPVTINMILKMGYIVIKNKINSNFGYPAYSMVANLDNKKLKLIAELFEKGEKYFPPKFF